MGKQRLVLDLSCRRRGDTYFVVTDRWQRFSELAVDEATLTALTGSCDEFLVRLCTFLFACTMAPPCTGVQRGARMSQHRAVFGEFTSSRRP